MSAARRAATARRKLAVGMEKGGRSEAVDPAFHRAILKIALELKKPNAQSCEAIVERTVESMRLDPVAFRRYLGENGARNMSLLLATVRGGAL